MNIGFYACIILAALFAIIGVLFLLLGEKGASLVSGFNTMPPEKRAQYDKKRLSRDSRNSFFLWAVILLAGALLSLFLSPYFAIPAFIVWLVFFFREVHLDEDKAFEKYRL